MLYIFLQIYRNISNVGPGGEGSDGLE